MEPAQLSPPGFKIPVIEASLTAGGIQASDVINEARMGLFSRTVRILIF